MGTEESTCPICGGRLIHYDSRKRKAIGPLGDCLIFLLRRLRCTHCCRIHLELPDFLIPYKRYFKILVKKALNHEEHYVPFCESTRTRWLKWFKDIRQQLENSLQSLVSRKLLSPVFKDFHPIDFVKELVNHNLWPFHPKGIFKTGRM